MVERPIGPLHVADAGRGRPVVLIHGWATSGRVLGGLAETLAARFRVVVPDLRGHGRSPPPPGPFSLDDHGADVADLVRRLGLERPVLAGWSMGAQVALAAAAEGRARGAGGVAGLALLAATARFTSRDGDGRGLPPEQVEGLKARLRIHAGKALGRFFAACISEGEVDAAGRRRIQALLGAEPPGTAAALDALDALAAGDQRAALPSIVAPVLLVHGGRDAIVPPAASEAMAAALPRARRVLLAGAGHAAFLTRPDEVAGAIGDFVAALPDAAEAP
jgi:pimeloyl-[acyl-carrier protein] methyl ester esterase